MVRKESRSRGRVCQAQLQFREDSQIDFAMANVFLHVWGGGGSGVLQKNVSQILNNRFFQAEKLPEKFKKPCLQRRIYIYR